MESKNFTAAVFCSRLKSARIKAKLSQTELANRIGRPQTRISSYETGRTMPDAQTLADICRAEEKQAKKEINGGDWADYLLRMIENPPTVKGWVEDPYGGAQDVTADMVSLSNHVPSKCDLEVFENLREPCAVLEFYGKEAAAFFKEICAMDSVKENLPPEMVETLRQHACETAAAVFFPVEISEDLDELPF